MTPGRVRRVSGPLVEIDDLGGVAMAEVVELGSHRLAAEVVALHRADTGASRAVAQAYEYTGGLRPGHAVHRTGRPLAALLGPGLLGGIFDGLLRPLRDAPAWLSPEAARATDRRRWAFAPKLSAGVEVGPGDVLGTVEGAGPIPHRVLVPPGQRGRLRSIAPPERYGVDEPVAWVGSADVTLGTWWPVRQPRPYAQRLSEAEPLRTGQRVLDAVFPVRKGGAAAVPGGFGTGKTVLLQQIAKWCEADVIVYVGCGERGNKMADVVTELAELSDPRTGGRLADRTVIIANTSNMPIMAREASIYTGVTVAEYYRDMGYDAVVIADSTSRWAEALREFASRVGSLPAEEGYPATLASALAAFYERAALVTPLGGGTGSVTIIGAVSPPGGDTTEPVTAHTQRFVRSLWNLDRDLAYARHYPAVAWAGSYCRDAARIGAWHATHGDPRWAARRARVISLLSEAGRLAELADLVGVGALPAPERVVMLAGRLLREGVLQQSALSANDASCPPARTAALIDAVLSTTDVAQELAASGTPATAIEECDFGPLLRAREDVPADSTDGVPRAGAEVAGRLRRLA